MYNENKKYFLIVGFLSMAMILCQFISCNNNPKKKVKVSIEDLENVLTKKNNLIGEKVISKKYIIEIVEPDETVDYKIIISKPEDNVDPNMVVENPNKQNNIDTKNSGNKVPEDISSEIKVFIKKIEEKQEK